ncbi:MAG: ABC transporter permease [Candidatus Marinimicrobia bacterium]|nr:ABC transporter permease [Candidatus Neomarinimicrobiota bacterium]RKY56799.1 MAG: peptide ABC transporter permease [Candidatus Neomarinimicrobiota bacterium]
MISVLIGLWENVLIAVRALAQNKMRAVLTTLGIIIGVLTVVSVASIIAGLNKGFSSQISALGSNTLFIHKYPWIIMDDFFKYRNRPDITMDDARYLMKHSKLAKAIAPATGTSRNIKYRDKSLTDISISGVTVEHESIEGYKIAEGRYFTQNEIDRDKPSCIIGWEIKEKLFDNLPAIGERIKIGNVSYRVIGVMEKRGSLLGYDLDSEVYVPIGTIFKNFGSRRSIRILVQVPSSDMINEVKDEIRFLMRVSRRLKPQEEDNFSINQQEMLTNMYKQLTGGLYTAAFGIGTLSLLVGGIGIMNIMLVSVAERRKEIGIRKALGAKRRVITFQFIIESIIICSVGGFIAIFLSFLISLVIDKVTPFPSSVPVWSVFMGLGFSTFVGLFFGIYPARRAAKLDPIECLRYE